MSIVRRITALTLASLVVGGFLAVAPVGAQQSERIVTAPEAYFAGASALGLEINLLGNRVTVGSSRVQIDSSPKAFAEGAGVAIIAGTVATAQATQTNQSQSPPPACVLNLPLLGLATVATACGQAQVTTQGGAPQAAAAGTIADIVVGGSLLTPLLDQLGAIAGTTIQGAITPLSNLLGGLLNPLLTNLNLNLSNTVGQLLEGLRRVTGLLTIRVGPSSSEARTSTSAVTSQGLAKGAEIQLLPGLSAVGAPLATIIVGDAKAAVNVTRPAESQTGQAIAQAVPSFDAALVRVLLGVPLLGNITDIPVGLGAPLTLLAGTPLESTISVGGGSTADGPNGSKIAVADGVSLDLLKGLTPGGGIAIRLAHAEASGGGLSAAVTIRQINPPVQQQPELARTGGDAWLPLVGAALLLAAFGIRRLALGRRR